MLKKLRERISGIGGIADLCRRAEAVARSMGEVEPAAEHFLFAALDMPDGTAAQALATLGQDRASLAGAIREQHIAALAAAGCQSAPDIDPLSASNIDPRVVLFLELATSVGMGVWRRRA